MVPDVNDVPIADFDAERALLGALMLDQAHIPSVRSIVKAGAREFANDAHARVYQVLCALADANKPVDGIIVRDELKRGNEFEELGGYSFLTNLISACPSSHNAEQYARVVHGHYIRRRAVEGAARIRKVAVSDGDLNRVISASAAAYEELAELNVSGSAGDGSYSGWLDDDLAAVFDGKSASNAIPTGYFALDEMTGGLQCGALTIIAARPSHGKTSLAHNIADRVCVTNGVPLQFFSLEMSVKSLLWMWAASRADVNGWILRKGIESCEGAYEKMREAVACIYSAASRLSIYGSRVRDLDSVINLVRIGVRRNGCKVFIVDYLGLMSIYGRFDRNDLKIGFAVSALKSIASDLDVAGVLLVQLNRANEKEGKPPRLVDLRDSGEIEQHADVVIFPHQRKEVDGPKRMESGPAELIVAKNRTGPTGVVDVEFRAHSTKFINPLGGVQ